MNSQRMTKMHRADWRRQQRKMEVSLLIITTLFITWDCFFPALVWYSNVIVSIFFALVRYTLTYILPVFDER
jgi:hypothetical protein